MADKKYLQKKEWVVYLTAIFFYATMTGVVGSYRQSYLINVLQLENSEVSMYNAVVGVLSFVLSFFYAVIIDNRKPSQSGKFKPLGMAVAVPFGICTVLMFISPRGLGSTLLLIYLITVAILQGACNTFAGTTNLVAVVMTPNNRERDRLLSFRGISSAIGNSAPLVFFILVGLIFKTEQMKYIMTAAVCGVIGAVSMFICMRIVKERTAYEKKRENPLLGYRDILGNKYALIVLLSNFLKGFRSIASYMGIFLAVALLGSTDKYILLGLPTGVGTFVGMLIINMLLKRFNSKQLYIASGIYSLIANCCAFGIGYIYFNNPDSVILEILFFVFLFLIGLQFGASNLLPSMFQADILEDLELKTGKRLDAGLGFVIGIGTTVSGLIANALAPIVLYGDNSVIHYLPPVDQLVNGEMTTVYLTQSYETKILLLFFYTIFHGIMMLLAGLPFFFYKLVGSERDRVHEEVLVHRQELEQQQANESNG